LLTPIGEYSPANQQEQAMAFARKGAVFVAIGGMALGAAFAAPALAQDAHMAGPPMFNSSFTLGLLEIPFLLLAIVYALRTAGALRGGVFGHGMGMMAFGLLVMAVGHLLMMADMLFGVNLLGVVLGNTLGSAFWVIALVASWGLMGFGFHGIYRASKA
jgi:hypothetical protein